MATFTIETMENRTKSKQQGCQLRAGDPGRKFLPANMSMTPWLLSQSKQWKQWKIELKVSSRAVKEGTGSRTDDFSLLIWAWTRGYLWIIEPKVHPSFWHARQLTPFLPSNHSFRTKDTTYLTSLLVHFHPELAKVSEVKRNSFHRKKAA